MCIYTQKLYFHIIHSYFIYYFFIVVTNFLELYLTVHLIQNIFKK
jgi:hypothetical protein